MAYILSIHCTQHEVHTMKTILLNAFLIIGLLASAHSQGLGLIPPQRYCDALELDNDAPAEKLISIRNQQFYDAQNRVNVLRGINLSGDSKVPPFTTVTSASMLDPLNEWGLNTIRLLFTWEALESTRCEYSENYMQYFEQVVEWAAERNLYVIVDFHQDAYSRWSIGGCGEGFPKWAVTNKVSLSEPLNDASCANWGTRMFVDLSHHKTWHEFHKDTNGVKTSFIDMQRYVANRMKKYSNVIGYDLINEPWGSGTELKSLYELSISAIHSQDPEAIIFVAPSAPDSSSLIRTRLEKPAGDHIVYAPHFYDPLVYVFGHWFGVNPAIFLDVKVNKANSWNAPFFLGEFGAPPDVGNVEPYMQAVYDWLNNGFYSSAQWSYTPTWRDDIKDGWNAEDFSISDDTGKLRDNFQVRAAPVAIAGTPLSFSEDENSMRLEWQHDSSAGNTEVFLPANFTENKTVLSSIGVNCSTSRYKLNCSSDSKGVKFVLVR